MAEDTQKIVLKLAKPGEPGYEVPKESVVKIRNFIRGEVVSANAPIPTDFLDRFQHPSGSLDSVKTEIVAKCPVDVNEFIAITNKNQLSVDELLRGNDMAELVYSSEMRNVPEKAATINAIKKNNFVLKIAGFVPGATSSIGRGEVLFPMFFGNSRLWGGRRTVDDAVEAVGDVKLTNSVMINGKVSESSTGIEIKSNNGRIVNEQGYAKPWDDVLSYLIENLFNAKSFPDESHREALKNALSTSSGKTTGLGESVLRTIAKSNIPTFEDSQNYAEIFKAGSNSGWRKMLKLVLMKNLTLSNSEAEDIINACVKSSIWDKSAGVNGTGIAHAFLSILGAAQLARYHGSYKESNNKKFDIFLYIGKNSTRYKAVLVKSRDDVFKLLNIYKFYVYIGIGRDTTMKIQGVV